MRVQLLILSLVLLAPVSAYAGIIAQWDFTGGSLSDLSGNGHHGSNPLGAIQTVDRFGNANSAYSFNKTPISTANWTGQLENSNVTYSLWATTPLGLNGGSGMLFNTGQTGQGPDLWLINNNVYWNIWDGFNNPFNVGAGVSGLTSGWHNWVVVNDFTNNRTQLFFDGAFVGQAAYRSPANDAFGIGGTNDPYSFRGAIDDVKIFDQALTQSEIGQLYQTGSVGGVVPEPTSLVLWSFGLVGMGFARRRRS